MNQAGALERRGGVAGSPTLARHGRSVAFRLGRLLRASLRPRRWTMRRASVVFLLALAALFSVALARGWSLARQVPEWWRAAGVADEAVAASRAEGVEKGVTAALYSNRPNGQAWTVELRSDDANAWMRERLPRWLANRGERWPEGVSPPRLRFEGGEVTLGVSMSSERLGGERILSVTFRPRLSDQGALLTESARAHIGRAPLPGVGASGANWTALLPDDWSRDQNAQRLLGALSGVGPLLDVTSIALEDGRTVRLTDLSIEQGRIRLTCVSRNGSVTEPP